MFGLSALSLALYAGIAVTIFGGGFEAARIWDAGTINGLKTQVAQGMTRETRLTDNVATCTANQKTLQASLDEANKATAALKAAGDMASARADTALAGLRTASAKAKAAADQVALLMRPASAEACTAADGVILGALR